MGRVSTLAEMFEEFLEGAESRLRHAFVARFGPDVGRDAAAEALAYGWEHWDRVGAMDNPTGYLFRVGQSRARRYRRMPLVLSGAPVGHDYEFEPGLIDALGGLSDRQRTVVVLVHCFDWLLSEVAELLDIGLTTVQKHEERGMAKLRKALEVSADV